MGEIPPLLILGIIIIVFLFLEGFLSGSEIALVAADRKRLNYLGNSKSRIARLTHRILQEPSLFLSTTLVGSNLAEVANTVLVTSVLISLYGSKGDLYAFLLLTPLILIYGEILPKTLFQQKADRWATKIIPFIWVLSIILFPLVWFMSWSTRFVLGLFGVKREKGPFVSREELQLLLLIEGEPTDMKPMEKDMIHRIFRFSGTKVREVMIPLVQVVALEENSSVEEAIFLTHQENYSRYPVFRERVDNIVGILHSFDLLLAQGKEQTIKPFVRPISFFPETKPIDELLLELQQNQEAMAAVVDEYGGAVGIVTVEDILEEVVGEIEDEYDVGQPLYKRIGPRKFLINARMEVDHINENLKFGLPKGDYETLGGFVLERMGRVPLPGEGFRFQGILFEVLKADERSVSEVLATLKE
ncbi:MAG: HlyC/CorC family transporter [Deltaproteobacteria bacterium]|nr:HlyC/CorC family transporter [Deltaproteobacteria bacterium]